MNNSDNFPDLSHWRPVVEFSIEQAALLTAEIDPFDCGSVRIAEENNHPRWKKAATFSLGIVAAIRQGMITPVICMARKNDNWEEWWETIKPSDRTLEICTFKTIITRASLENWIATQNIQFSTTKQRIAQTQNRPPPVIIEAAPEPLALPYRGHQSEGLEFVEEAIRQFWSTYDENDPATTPKKADVVEYLKKIGATGNMAGHVDAVLRPFSTHKSGLKKR